MKMNVSVLNSLLLAALLGVASFIGVTVFNMSGDAKANGAIVAMHTEQLKGIALDTRQALDLAKDTKGDLAALKQKVDSIRR